MPRKPPGPVQDGATLPCGLQSRRVGCPRGSPMSAPGRRNTRTQASVSCHHETEGSQGASRQGTARRREHGGGRPHRRSRGPHPRRCAQTPGAAPHPGVQTVGEPRDRLRVPAGLPAHRRAFRPVAGRLRHQLSGVPRRRSQRRETRGCLQDCRARRLDHCRLRRLEVVSALYNAAAGTPEPEQRRVGPPVRGPEPGRGGVPHVAGGRDPADQGPQVPAGPGPADGLRQRLRSAGRRRGPGAPAPGQPPLGAE